MWYLLLSFPAAALLMGLVVRTQPTTATDRVCSAIDVRLDHQQELISLAAPASAEWLPPQQRSSRVAPRPLATTGVLVS